MSDCERLYQAAVRLNNDGVASLMVAAPQQEQESTGGGSPPQQNDDDRSIPVALGNFRQALRMILAANELHDPNDMPARTPPTTVTTTVVSGFVGRPLYGKETVLFRVPALSASSSRGSGREEEDPCCPSHLIQYLGLPSDGQTRRSDSDPGAESSTTRFSYQGLSLFAERGFSMPSSTGIVTANFSSDPLANLTVASAIVLFNTAAAYHRRGLRIHKHLEAQRIQNHRVEPTRTTEEAGASRGSKVDGGTERVERQQQQLLLLLRKSHSLYTKSQALLQRLGAPSTSSSGHALLDLLGMATLSNLGVLSLQEADCAQAGSEGGAPGNQGAGASKLVFERLLIFVTTVQQDESNDRRAPSSADNPTTSRPATGCNATCSGSTEDRPRSRAAARGKLILEEYKQRFLANALTVLFPSNGDDDTISNGGGGGPTKASAA